MNRERWQRVKAVFSTAADLKGRERSEYLGEACGSDLLLRQEVDALLEEEGQVEDFLETPILKPLADTQSALLERFRKLGEFEIIREINGGTLGAVYLAHQPFENREVALKVIKKELGDDPLVVDRFRSEAKAVAALDHPNIVPLYASGKDRGVHYFAMEYVEGSSLAERLKELRQWRRMHSSSEPPGFLGSHAEGYLRFIVRLFATVADALEHAHSRGIIHGDVKPTNILLDSESRPRLIDFGLARDLKGTEASIPAEGVGSAPWMSPEQIERQSIDARTDVFSLGVCLYEALTLRLPFEGESAREVIKAILKRSPRSMSKTDRRLTRDLEAIAFRALEKLPENRYATAAALGKDLRRFLAGESVQARPISLTKRARRFFRV